MKLNVPQIKVKVCNVDKYEQVLSEHLNFQAEEYLLHQWRLGDPKRHIMKDSHAGRIMFKSCLCCHPCGCSSTLLTDVGGLT